MPSNFRRPHIALLIALPIISVLLSLCLGRMVIPLDSIIRSAGAKIGLSEIESISIEKVLWGIRLPRILMAMIVGVGLSLSGLTFQSLFANPLATPDTLGVASGASFGACLGILLGFSLRGIQVLSLLMGLTTVILTWISGRGKEGGTTSFVLSGIMIGSLFNALVSLIKYTADTETQLPSITYWLMGSMSGKGYSTLLLGSPLIILSSILLFFLRWRMNILPLSEDEAKSSGTDIKLLRSIAIITATAMTASCVSMCGQVGWIGLIVPHISRMMFGDDHRKLVPASISLGAVFVVLVDTACRTISASEIPISILTAIIGAPFFIYLMRQKER